MGARSKTDVTGIAAAETRERIVDEARNLFLERGYRSAAMSELAKRAGVTTPALYWHFKSKTEIYGEVVLRDYEGFLSEFRKRVVGITPTDRLRAFVATYVELQLRGRQLPISVGYAQLRDEVPSAAQSAIRETEDEVIGELKNILRDGSAAGEFSVLDTTVTTYALIDMCEWVYTWFNPTGRLSLPETAATYAEFALRAVQAPG